MIQGGRFIMRAICFIQEVKGGDLTMRQQILICRKALSKRA